MLYVIRYWLAVWQGNNNNTFAGFVVGLVVEVITRGGTKHEEL